MGQLKNKNQEKEKAVKLWGTLQKEETNYVFAQMSCHCYNNKLTKFCQILFF